MSCVILDLSGWFGYQVHVVTILLVGFYCTVVHILLKSTSAFSVGVLGVRTSEKGIQPFWKVWVLMHMLLRHIQQLPLDPCWKDFHDRRKKKCPGLKELMGLTYEAAPKASCSQIFGVTLTKNQRKGVTLWSFSTGKGKRSPATLCLSHPFPSPLP